MVHVHRNRFAVALCLLLALANSIGSNAGALPGVRTTVNLVEPKKQPQQCLANLKRPGSSGMECLIPRGGSSSSLSAASSESASLESLKLVGLAQLTERVREGVSTAFANWWSQAETTKFLLAGAVAGIVSRTAVSPLEVVATAQMVRGGSKNMMGELADLFSKGGIKGFFNGNGANCLKVAPTRGVQFFAFEKFKKSLVSYKKASMGLDEDADVRLNPIERLIAGGFAGMIASSMVYPIEVVKTMLTMYPGKYNGIASAFRGVLNEVGPKGLYAGLAPTLVAMFPYVGVEFMIYESSKIAIEQFMREESGEPDVPIVLPVIMSLGLGALAGAAAQTSAHPLDVVRKRLQVQGINGNPVLYKNTFDCAKGVATKEGMGALYKGLGPACVATIPGTGIAYITYETMKRMLSLSSV